MRGRVETALQTEDILTEDGHPLPPPPPPREGEPGYEEYLKRRATEDLAYHEQQAKK